MKSNTIKKIGCLEIITLNSSDIEWCQGHKDLETKFNKGAVFRAFIMGKSAGGLCKSCAKEWSNIWQDISGKEEVIERKKRPQKNSNLQPHV